MTASPPRTSGRSGPAAPGPVPAPVPPTARRAAEGLGAIQSRAHRIGAGTDVAARLRGVGDVGLDRAVLVIEQLEDLAHASTVDDLLVERLDGLLDQGATVIIGSRSPEATSAERLLSSALRDPQRLSALSLQRSTDSAPEGALV